MYYSSTCVLICWNLDLVQYSKFVKPAFDDFILPTKKYADIIIPRGGDNHVAIDLIVQHIRTKLGQHDLCKIYPNLYVIQSTFQVLVFCFCIYKGCILFKIQTGLTYIIVSTSNSLLGSVLFLIFSFEILYHSDTWYAYTYTWCSDNEAWFCFLCWSIDSFGGLLFTIVLSLFWRMSVL